MAMMAQGKVIRLTPVTFEFKDEDFCEYQVLSYYFEVESLTDVITLLDLGKLVRSMHWPESWKIDSSWSFEFIDFRDGLFREKNTLYYDLYFYGEDEPIGHLIRSANSWTVVKIIKKEFHILRGCFDLEDILTNYFPNFYRSNFKCEKSNGLYLHITFDTIFDKPSGSWVHN
jgi:hypothetical protein